MSIMAIPLYKMIFHWILDSLKIIFGSIFPKGNAQNCINGIVGDDYSLCRGTGDRSL